MHQKMLALMRTFAPPAAKKAKAAKEDPPADLQIGLFEEAR
jgi:hypothetical protein